LITGILAVNPTVGTDGSNTVTVDVIVLEVGFAFAGLTAKPSARAMLAKPASMVLEILFTIFLENLWQQDLVALPNFSRLEIWGEQNVRVAHHFQAKPAIKYGWLPEGNQPYLDKSF